MKKSSIIAAIKERVEGSQGKNYAAWTIGITNDLERRTKEHEEKGESTAYLKSWEADSLDDAQAIETYFLNEHKPPMKGGTGGDLNARKICYVYIF